MKRYINVYPDSLGLGIGHPTKRVADSAASCERLATLCVTVTKAGKVTVKVLAPKKRKATK